MKKFKLSISIIVSSIAMTSFAFAQAAPGVEERCADARDTCLDAVQNAGTADACERQYFFCINRGDRCGATYKSCIKAAKSPESREACMDAYQDCRY